MTATITERASGTQRVISASYLVGCDGAHSSVRRAMGASKRSVFAQLLVEAALVGLAGGGVGLLLAAFGLWVVRQQPVEYAAFAHMDGAMLAATFVLAVCATLLAALFPAWRACRIVPARLLKTQ